MFNLNETVAQKVLDVVRHGLSGGLGVREPGYMCVEAAVCYALGLPHSDDPKCVDQALRNFKIILNDSMWSSNKTRAKGLERLAIAQLGTLNTLNTKAFIDGLVVLSKKWVDQAALDAGVSLAYYTADASYAAADAAYHAVLASYQAAAVARAAADAATVAYAGANTAHAAYHAVLTAYYAAADAGSAVASAARAAGNAGNAAASAARAAGNAGNAAYYDAYYADGDRDKALIQRDKVLAQCAEDVVQLLIKLEAPGTKYLYLTENKV